jgi:hypothetical protein
LNIARLLAVGGLALREVGLNLGKSRIVRTNGKKNAA